MTEPPRILDLYRRTPPRRTSSLSVTSTTTVVAGDDDALVVRTLEIEARSDGPALPANCLNVTQLANRMKGQLEQSGEVHVVGEVTGFKAASQGHWYFDLKDKVSKLSVVIFFTNAKRCTAPADGDLVVVTGTPSFHGGFGRAQLMARAVEAVGAGAEAKKLEALKAKLQQAGCFDVDRKRALPLLPTVVGLVTSLQGAAVRDVLKVISGRNKRVSVVIANTKVQGDGAAAEVADAIRRLDASNLCDVILVVRGGGAREDLHAFNTEPVVRAIGACRVPVVAGVGHEVDVTLADLAADVRAATPSQAGELAVPREDELRARLEQAQNRLVRHVDGVVARGQQRLARLERRLPAPAALERRLALPVERLEARLERMSPRAQVAQRAKSLEALTARLARLAPQADVVAATARLRALEARLDAAIGAQRDRQAARLDAAIASLDALSPLAVLRRGWALVTVPATASTPAKLAQGRDLVVGTRLHVRLADGEADVVVIDDRGTEPS